MNLRPSTFGYALLGIAIGVAAAAGAIIVSGIYDVGATEQHTAPVYRLLDFAKRRSVKLRAAAVQTPELNRPERQLSGYLIYRSHCLQCHGAPGIAADRGAMGMSPAPASLVATARTWAAAEIYWVIRHGIKLTGMPAWEYRMSDREMWDVVAFVATMPALSPQQYRQLGERAGGSPSPDTQAPAAMAAVEKIRPGEAAAGRRAIGQYLCATCHEIPGIAGAYNHVGPPLGGVAQRAFIAGVLPNTPANMVRWLRQPTQVDPLTAMPDLGMSEQDARDIAAYLYGMSGKD